MRAAWGSSGQALPIFGCPPSVAVPRPIPCLCLEQRLSSRSALTSTTTYATMKTEWLSNCIRTLLLSLAVAAWGEIPLLGQDAVYPAHPYASDTNFVAPFYWIDSGHNSPWGSSTSMSTATTPVGTPTRAGSWYHTLNVFAAGDGYGLVHVSGSEEDAVYEVQVTQPSYRLTTDLIMNVGSTNCDIGTVFGATAAGGWTNTTAFQAVYAANQWARVCYLTNRAGVTQPHIDFKYASGSGGSGADHTFADCVRFHLVIPGSNAPTPARVTSIAGTSVSYTGGSGTRFILLRSDSLGTPLGDWERVATNSVTPSSFPIPPVGANEAAFYAIASE